MTAKKPIELHKKSGRPSNKIDVVYQGLEWEYAGTNKLGFTSQSLYVAEYKRIQILKQVIRLKNARCFTLYYWEFSKKINNCEQDLINEVHEYWSKIK